MVQEVLIYISLIIAVSALLTILARLIRQPPIIAYLVAGVLVGPLVFNWIGASSSSASLIQTFARIGVAFLLFIVGLSLDFRLLKEIGKVSTIAGIIQVGIISFLGFVICLAFGLNNITSLYIGVALAFSSTVVVVKILSDKKEIDTLHGRIAIGILIIQDIIASVALMVVPLAKNNMQISSIFQQIGVAIITIIFVFLVSRFVFGSFMNYLAKSQETLFLFGIAWALAIATVFYKLGFSMEIGALIAGMSLASSKYALDLEGKMKPLRDFFVVLFFVFFGSQLTGVNYLIIKQAIILSIFVMIIKPLVVMFTLKLYGYTKKTNFLTSISLAQVSEFSLILILVGFSLGHLNSQIMNLIVLVTLFTIAISTYAINYSHLLNEWLSKFLDLFDCKNKKTEETKVENYDIILFGYHRMGYKLLDTFKKMGMSFVIIDYNPKVVISLNKQKIESIFGDAGNKNFLNDIPLENAKLVISTIPEEASNLAIKEKLEEINSKATFIATAEQPRTALELYDAGADYVLIPHHLGGDYASKIISEFKTNKEKYEKIGKEHKQSLEKSKRNSTFNES
jgi:Kef-type K+ transport system membrane component KefB/Trk K+ transport system NAD-binding subunit